jgi:hypothetical protein
VANFSPSNYETPITGVDLKWPSPPKKGEPGEWLPSIVRLWNSFKKNEYSKFFYQSDVESLWITCDRYNRAHHNPNVTAAEWRALDDQLGKYGTTVKDRANLRYVLVKTASPEAAGVDIAGLMRAAFGEESD